VPAGEGEGGKGGGGEVQIRRVMEGERDREALLAGLDEVDTAILTLALDLVEG